MIAAIVYILVGFIEILVGFRFLFKLLGANPASALVGWVYDLSGPLVAPFAGIFGQNAATVPGTGSVFEWTTLIALLFYGFIGAIVIGLISRTHHHGAY
ncbi:MAG TPA: hypothetical protein VJ836_04695 [Candidatus Saccharimonadales bacterium]|nr:hypothetical protein [Candidatus Saccharimonadales bacterium]